MPTRRILLASALATALAGLAPAPEAAAQEKSVLRAVLHAPLRIPDPIVTTAYINRNHGYMIYDTLFAVDAAQKIQPQMVERWEASADKMTWTFTLRDGLKFHDGAPVTSANVIASLVRWAKRDSMGQAMAAATKEWKAVNDKTFQLVLKEPFGLVLESLGKPSSNVPFVMPKRVAEADATKSIAEHAPNDWHIGSGPFKFVRAEFQPGVKTVYEKNPDYVPRKEAASWLAGGKVVKVDRVEWINVGDAQTTASALLKGEIDFWETALYDNIPTLEKNKDVVVKVHLAPQSFWMRINWLHPPFNNEKIRQAVLYAIQQEDYLVAQVGDAKYYKKCGAFFTCGTSFGFEDGAAHLGNPNIEKAKQLLKEGGYKGEPVVIMTPTDLRILASLAPVTAQALRKIGMNVELVSMDWGSLVARRAKTDPPAQGGWSIFHTAWANPDLLNPVTNAGMNGKGVQGGFFGWTEDPEMEKLRAQFVRETDPGKQKALVHTIHKRAYDKVFYVPLGEFLVPYGYRANVKGILDGPAPVFWNIEKTK